MWLFHCFTVILIYQTITSFFILVLNLLFTGISSTFRTEPRPKGALKNFAKFTGKQQCQSIFFKKVTGLRTGVFWNFAKFTGKQQCQSTFFKKVVGLRPALLKETLAQVYFVEFCEISKNTFFYRTPLVAASGCAFRKYRNGKAVSENPDLHHVLNISVAKRLRLLTSIKATWFLE